MSTYHKYKHSRAHNKLLNNIIILKKIFFYNLCHSRNFINKNNAKFRNLNFK